MCVACFWHRRDHDFNHSFPDNILLKLLHFFLSESVFSNLINFHLPLIRWHWFAIQVVKGGFRQQDRLQGSGASSSSLWDPEGPWRDFTCQGQSLYSAHLSFKHRGFPQQEEEKRDFSSARPLFRRSTFRSLSWLLSRDTLLKCSGRKDGAAFKLGSI